MADEAEPAGLDLSLDDLIKKTKPADQGQHHRRRRDYDDGPGPHRAPRRGGYDGGRGRGGHHGGRGGGGYGDRRPYEQQRRYQPIPPRLKAFIDETGTVVVKSGDGKRQFVQVTPAGDMTLSTGVEGGNYNKPTLDSLNEILNPVNVRITSNSEDASEGNWTVSDGRSLRRFEDGLIVPGKGQMDRGQTILQNIRSKYQHQQHHHHNQHPRGGFPPHMAQQPPPFGMMPPQAGFSPPPFGGPGGFGMGAMPSPQQMMMMGMGSPMGMMMGGGVRPPPPPSRGGGGGRGGGFGGGRGDGHNGGTPGDGGDKEQRKGSVFERLGPSGGGGGQQDGRYRPY